MVQEASGSAEQAILNRKKQRIAAQRLVAWLCQRHEVKVTDVIGHAMANDSRFFRDDQGWHNDHSDWPENPTEEFRRGFARSATGERFGLVRRAQVIACANAS